MKKISLLVIATFISVISIAQSQWVDLGLLSGTLWASAPEEGYYTYEEAKTLLGKNMPTQWQWNELYQSCEVEHFDSKGKYGVLFTGVNGNSLFIPSMGMIEPNGSKPHDKDKAMYWSFSTAGHNTKQAYYAHVNYDIVFYPKDKTTKMSVIRVSR